MAAVEEKIRSLTIEERALERERQIESQYCDPGEF